MRLLDLFCGAGGAAVGYHRAGFDDITGVDNKPMLRYPFEFVLGDALEYVIEHGAEFDVIHASPPCQEYSVTKSLTIRDYPKVIEHLRDLLIETGKPYIIENVYGAPLINPHLLCGAMFGLKTYRHRLFEMSFDFPLLGHPGHGLKSDRLTGSKRRRDMVTVVGKGGYKGANQRYREAMEIDWMNEAEITEAIPPAYTEFIGRRIMEGLDAA